MKKTIEITKNTEYYARVRDNEDVDDAIIRFMDKNGFETEVWTDGKG